MAIPLAETSVKAYKAEYQLSVDLSSYGMHYHDSYEFLFHRRNGSVLYIGCEAYDMQPYELYIIPPFQIHSRARFVRLIDYERMYLYLTTDMLQRMGQQVVPVKEIIDDGIHRNHYRFLLTPEEYEETKAILVKIRNCGEGDAPYEQLEDRIRLEQLVCTISRIVSQRRGAEQPESESHMPMLDVLRYINTHYTENLTLDSLSEQFSISKSYLAHEFSKCFNMSIYQYILMNRIIYARQLIAQGESMLSVALQCGFNDYSNFLRAFTRHTGRTPSEWKKNAPNGAFEKATS